MKKLNFLTIICVTAITLTGCSDNTVQDLKTTQNNVSFIKDNHVAQYEISATYQKQLIQNYLTLYFSPWHNPYQFADEKKLIEIVQAHPSVESFVAISSYSEFRKGLNFVHLKPRGKRPKIQQVIQELYTQLSEIPGLQVFIKNIPLIDLSIGPQSKGSFQYALQALNPDELYLAAEKLMAGLYD
jgi:hypothetical protein